MASFEELLKTPKGIEEAESYLERLKVEYIETENVIRMRKMVRKAKDCFSLIDDAENNLGGDDG
jgi:hypothetical protein